MHFRNSYDDINNELSLQIIFGERSLQVILISGNIKK